MNIIVSAGGTGGHIYPALAIINEFKKQEKDLNVLYIGTHNRMEGKIAIENNIPFESIEIYGFDKKKIFRDIKNIALIIKSYEKCIKIMKDFKPDAVIGAGGYVTMPVIMAAKKLKVKTFIHEQNMIPGKANKFLANGVDTVFTSFIASNKYFDNSRVIFSGNPSGDNVYNLKNITKESFGATKSKKCILITFGSLGSSSMSEKLIDYLNNIKDYEVIMNTGTNNYEYVKNNVKNKNVFIVPYINDQAGLFKNIDLIISRAGATTLSEIINANVPSIIIPSPYVANNHQYYNALELANDGGCILIEEKDISKEIIEENVLKLLNDKEYYQDMKQNLKKLATKNSSKIIYDSIKEQIYE